VDPKPQFWAVGPEGPEGIPALHPLAHPPHSHPYTRHPPTRSSKSFLLHSHIPILFLHRPGARSPPSAVPSFSHSHKPLSSRPHARSLIPAVTANANANATSTAPLGPSPRLAVCCAECSAVLEATSIGAFVGSEWIGSVPLIATHVSRGRADLILYSCFGHLSARLI
jgi:hypothetical protein